MASSGTKPLTSAKRDAWGFKLEDRDWAEELQAVSYAEANTGIGPRLACVSIWIGSSQNMELAAACLLLISVTCSSG